MEPRSKQDDDLRAANAPEGSSRDNRDPRAGVDPAGRFIFGGGPTGEHGVELETMVAWIDHTHEENGVVYFEVQVKQLVRTQEGEQRSRT